MKTFDLCKEYCMGCGLCKSELHVDMKKNEKGFLFPELPENKKTEQFLEQVCPIAHNCVDEQNTGIWGSYIHAYAGYSTDAVIRQKASSGGALTGIALYLLESGKVDGIIQVTADKENPVETVVQVSTTAEQVLACCGSRYSISSPWLHLSECMKSGKTYAAIGKPCDIRALRRLREYDDTYRAIKYLLSFFCAGLPSKDANAKLLATLGCKEKMCKSLTYRGNGWPGTVTAIDDEKNTYQMEYSQAWGGILGRDIHPYCRICFDGIGECADIACGDGWYMDAHGNPDFTERPGRNVIFSRTQIGEELLREVEIDGKISLSDWEDVGTLRKIQNYQYTRKATMRAKKLAYRMLLRKFPDYDKNLLRSYAAMVPIKKRMKIFLGTAKRIVQKRI